MTAAERKGWLLIGGVNLAAVLYALAILAWAAGAFGCGGAPAAESYTLRVGSCAGALSLIRDGAEVVKAASTFSLDCPDTDYTGAVGAQGGAVAGYFDATGVNVTLFLSFGGIGRVSTVTAHRYSDAWAGAAVNVPDAHLFEAAAFDLYDFRAVPR